MKIILGLPVLLLLVAALLACSKPPTPTPVTPTATPAPTATPRPTEIPHRVENLKSGHHEIPITPPTDSLLQLNYKSSKDMTVAVSDQSGKIYFSGGDVQGSGVAILKASTLYYIIVGVQTDATLQYRLVANKPQ